jgi:hypothetical protein
VLFLREKGEYLFEFFILAGIQVAQYEDKFIDFFRRTMTQLKTVKNLKINFLFFCI